VCTKELGDEKPHIKNAHSPESKNTIRPPALRPPDHLNAHQVGDTTNHAGKHPPAGKFAPLWHLAVPFHKSVNESARRICTAADLNNTPSQQLSDQLHRSRAVRADIKRQCHQLAEGPRTSNATCRFPHSPHNNLLFLFVNRSLSPRRAPL
jgi:hypothetical protein